MSSFPLIDITSVKTYAYKFGRSGLTQRNLTLTCKRYGEHTKERYHNNTQRLSCACLIKFQDYEKPKKHLLMRLIMKIANLPPKRILLVRCSMFEDFREAI
ncbi:hypothetical protein BD770DRAFT_427291 [Pilaira anomala]|nr:hypothetical protein BD770DRAFT_427291 [Pilaira anomala]